MTTPTTPQHFTLHDVTSPGSFLGADSDLHQVITEAKRLVLSRRYSHLKIKDAQNTVIVRIYRSIIQNGVWISWLLNDDVEAVIHPSEPYLFDQDAPEQLRLPGMSDIR